MTELKNELSWSVTRHRNFEECRRRYYLNYYAHWGGWEFGADELARKCYQFTKMQNLDTWAGDIVHSSIEATLKRLQSGKSVSLDGIKQSALTQLRNGWKESKEQLWRDNPKQFTNLFEHYYNIEIPKERTDEIKNKILLCLENFWNSEIFAFIRSTDHRSWKAIEQLRTFALGECKIWVRIDFALSHQGFLSIYDWKSGKEEESDLRQLVCYALYAMEVWAFPHDRIKIIPFYLKENSFKEHTLTPEQIIDAKEEIFQSVARMVAVLDDPVENRASIENFQMTTDIRKCKRCFFQEICYGEGFAAKGSNLFEFE